MTLENLVSKVLAAGLAAGLFLLWWPAHLPGSGVEWLVLRGVAWALAFEILVLSFSPLERMAARVLTRRHAATGARRVRGRLAAAPAGARAGGAVLLACTGALVPLVLLAHAGRPPVRAAARPATVVRKVVVRKVVREKTVVVRTPPAPAPAPALAATTAKATATAPRAVKTPAATKRAAAKTDAPAAEQATKTTPATTAPAPAAADPVAPAAPAEPTAGAADETAPGG